MSQVIEVRYIGPYRVVSVADIEFERDKWVAIPTSIAKLILGDPAKNIIPSPEFEQRKPAKAKPASTVVEAPNELPQEVATVEPEQTTEQISQ